MKEEEIERLERRLSIHLPGSYRASLLGHDFPRDSFVTEYLLRDDTDVLIREQAEAISIVHHARSSVVPDAPLFLIGDDGGEEMYLVDLNDRNTPVYVYDFELGTIEVKCPSLEEWVDECRRIEEEIAEDEAEMERRQAKARWWQLWK